MVSPKVKKEKKLIFIKLGGSLITDKSKPYTPREDVIQRLCQEIEEARCSSDLSLLVGHGGGSFPHVSASRYQTHLGLVNEQSLEGFIRVHQDAVKLNRIVSDALATQGVLSYTIHPSSACVTEGRRIKSWHVRPIEMLLDSGIIPLVYGDVSLDEAQGVCIISTEEIFRHLAGELSPQEIILVGKVDGVLDSRRNVTPYITRENFDELRQSLQNSDGVADVTGGMLQKVALSLQMNLKTRIINGLKPGILKKALLGEDVLGTLINGTS